ncbi:N-acetylmuramoyl-L-alanine amidase [Cryomorphaceae bacterium]|nr:N-acetylmuramoyl-L-alanine amidase [Cryomorphaceae bacterium]
MGQFLWLLDNGHGGVMDGVYQTPGKRSPLWDDGTQLFEGEFNRAIVNRLIELCVPEGIRYQNIVPELEDVSLGERVRRANAYHPQDSCIYVSVHSNAGGGRGYEVFTSKGETRSDRVATVFFDHFKQQFPHKAMRSDVSDGDVDKEANFYVLRKTLMPAVLTENFFMDNEEECKDILMTREGRDKIAMAHFTAMQHIEANGLPG